MRVIKEELNSIGYKTERISLGEVVLQGQFSPDKLNLIYDHLEVNGFERVIDPNNILVEQIKTAVIELVHYSSYNSRIRNSDYLVDKLGYSYQHLSSVFSRYENKTLERFVILHKIERVKELIDYGELSLSEIAFMLGYSSVQYLSTQFRSVTGHSVSDYKKTGNPVRVSLDLL